MPLGKPLLSLLQSAPPHISTNTSTLSCPQVDICDFLKTARANLEMAAVIRKLQEAVEMARAEAAKEAAAEGGDAEAAAEDEAEEEGERQQQQQTRQEGSGTCKVQSIRADAGCPILRLPVRQFADTTHRYMWTAAAHSLILSICRVPVAAEEAGEEQAEGGEQQREQPPAKRQQQDGGKSPSKPAVAATAGDSHTTTNTDGSNGSGAGKQMAVSDHQVPSSAKPAAEAAAALAVNPEAAKRGELVLFCWSLGVGQWAGLYTGHPWCELSPAPVCSFVAAGTRYVSEHRDGCLPSPS